MQKKVNSNINQILPLRIEVCGGIASGKTTFAKLISQIKINPILEAFRINPFRQAWYSTPAKYGFETEISFMLQHYHQIKKEQVPHKINVCDFSFILDIAYAEIGLRSSQLDAFMTVYKEVKKELLHPSLLIYLDCNAETEMNRIRRRKRDVEKTITLKFLDFLNQAVKNQAKKASRYLDVITINSAEKDFVDNESIKQEIINLIKARKVLGLDI